jgi:hypothetical protein
MTQASVEASAAVDGLVFVLNGPLKADEAEAARLFLESSLSTGVGGVVGVLTKADQLGAGSADDPLAAAENLARETAEDHPELFADVVPVVGLLAESWRTGALHEDDANALAALVQATPPAMFALATADLTTLDDIDCDVPVPARRRLLDLLGGYGMREAGTRARAAIADGQRFGAPQLWDLAGTLSGYAELRAAVQRHLLSRVDVLKARRALSVLEDVAKGRAGAVPSGGEDGRAWLNAALQEADDAGDLLGLTLAEHAIAARSGRLTLPDELRADLVALAESFPLVPDPSTVSARMAAWQSFALYAPVTTRPTVDTATRALALAAQGIAGGSA